MGHAQVRRHHECRPRRRWDIFVTGVLVTGLTMEALGWGKDDEWSHWWRDRFQTDTRKGRVLFVTTAAGGGSAMLGWFVLHILDPEDNWLFESLDSEVIHGRSPLRQSPAWRGS